MMKPAHLTHLEHLHTGNTMRKRLEPKTEHEMISEGLIRRSLGGHEMTMKGIMALAKSKMVSAVK